MTETDSIVSRASESKRRVGRAVSINGVNAVDVTLNKSANLRDPILDVNVKVNNPIGRLWLAIKRMWKSQNTVIALKFTIPIIVLPVVIYVLWAIWQGRGVSTPVSKLGIVHQVKISGVYTDMLIVPTSDVYTLAYDASFNNSHRLLEKPVIVVGTFKHLDNTFYVEDVIAYNLVDIIPENKQPVSPPAGMWDSILRFIGQFK